MSSSSGVANGGGSNNKDIMALNASVTKAVGEKEGPVEVLRTDYQPLELIVGKIHMDFVIYDGKTVVTSKLFVETNDKNPKKRKTKGDDGDDYSSVLILDGDETCVKLFKLVIDNKDNLVEGKDYTLEPGKLILKGIKPGSVVTTVVEIVPEENTKLMGLYQSGDVYCTQCEAMGFRRITYSSDRPDNMAIFERVRLEANTKNCPVLLSNGNLIESGKVPNDVDRHYAIWQDPFPKPSYLFCCVAGKLEYLQDNFVTKSGRKVDLRIYSDPKDVPKLHHAMKSIKQAFKWDEDRYGLEYDLDLFNVVAIESFNMGAMENKGLNVFNTSCVLADQHSATDMDFERVQGIVGHEYFHNWTGNRVTCRDWFQLTLKEGLTVFRDQEFSADMTGSKAVLRIEKVKNLRARQFREDAGPMSHPIRPDSYISMDNFYTTTVYRKGAEIIRMYQTILSGEAGFRKGMDLYFQRHDGCAVTCEDFLSAMQDANDVDLQQFSRWYSTSGTPTVKYQYNYDETAGKLSLTLTQESRCPEPLHIPVSVGLLDKSTGDEVVPTKVLHLKEPKQTFQFADLKGDVVPSILRHFSAPVKLIPASGVEDEESLAFLATNDKDGFNKWEAGQKLFTSLIFSHLKGAPSEKTESYCQEAFGRTLRDKDTTDYSIIAYALMLPTDSTLAELVEGVVDPIGVHTARDTVRKELARKFHGLLKERYDELTDAMSENGNKTFSVDAVAIGRRRLRNVCLSYLCSICKSAEEGEIAAGMAMKHFQEENCLTDKIAALSALVSLDGAGKISETRDNAIEMFYNDAKGDALVLNKWFAIQAGADRPDVIDCVRKLKEHPDFSLKNPNRCRSLLSFFVANVHFHDESGKGYELLGDVLGEIDALNPRVSSSLALSFIQWKKYSESRGIQMKAQLQKLSEMKPISNDLYEIVMRGLK